MIGDRERERKKERRREREREREGGEREREKRKGGVENLSLYSLCCQRVFVLGGEIVWISEASTREIRLFGGRVLGAEAALISG